MNVGKIGVLAGGDSKEREISLKSGTAVYNALKEKGCDVKLIDMVSDDDAILDTLDVHVAFVALHGGFGENGTVQGKLEKRKIPYTGSDQRSSSIAMNKITSRQLFQNGEIPVPKYYLVKKDCHFGRLKGFGVPVVVKPITEGSSIGLSVVRNIDAFPQALEEAFRYGDTVIVEKYIDGKELTVGIFEDKALPVIEIVSKDNVYNYSAKYMDSETEYIVPAKIDDKTKDKACELALKAHKILGCRDFSRVDMRMDNKGVIYVLEINTVPGLTERSLLPKAANAIGIGFGDLCLKLVDLAAKRKK